jgi:tetratricopeptide (TPR) repeat protein
MALYTHDYYCPLIKSSPVRTGKIHHLRGSTSTADKYFEKSMAEIQAQLNFQILDHSANLGTEHKPIKSPRSLLLQAQSSLANQELKFADLTLLCGVLLKQASRYSESLVCLDFAHEIFTKILKPSSLRISEVLLEKGCVFSELKEYANASFVLEQLLALCKNTSANSSKQVVEGMRLLGICERKLGHNEKYVTLLKQIATMTKKSPSTGRQIDRYEDTNVLFLVGNLHYEQNQVVAALGFYKRCSNLFRSMKGGKSRRSMLEVAIATGNAYLKGGSPFRALMSFEQALFDAEGMGSTLLVYESLSSMVRLNLSYTSTFIRISSI